VGKGGGERGRAKWRQQSPWLRWRLKRRALLHTSSDRVEGMECLRLPVGYVCRGRWVIRQLQSSVLIWCI
jgi:hypothetical protein